MGSVGEGKKKSNQVAFILSGLLPGLGQLYNGDVAKGVAFLVGFIVLDALLRPEGWFDILRGKIPLTAGLIIRLGILAVFVVLSILDADRSAKAKNKNSFPS